MPVLRSSELVEWTQRLERAEELCPWPGPRPLTSSDRDLLIGRDQDFPVFLAQCKQHQIVLLHGESGVGKSSLLDALFFPALQDEGYFVTVCRDWGGQGHAAGDYLGRNLFQSMDPLDSGLLQPDESIFEDLDLEYGDRCVLVFDQFEELIRYNPDLLEDIIDLVIRLSESTSLRIVLSFRSEYLHELRGLENKAAPYRMARFALRPVDPKWGFAIAKSGKSRMPGEVLAIDDEAARAVAALWTEARGSTGAVASGNVRVGLLHLQGLLYTLDARVGSQGTVTSADLDGYIKSIQSRRGQVLDAGDVLREGLTDSVTTKLARSRTAAQESGIDPFLIEGTTQHLAQAVSHLSSGGYKLVRSLPELAKATLKSESETLEGGINDEGADKAKSEMKTAHLPERSVTRDALMAVLSDDLLSEDGSVEPASGLGICAGRITLAKRADAWLSSRGVKSDYWVPNLRDGLPAAEADRIGTSVGPMAGQSQAAVLIEETRRFAFAIYWLLKCSLIRITRPGEGTPMVSLIHDGFGDALEAWSATELDGDVAVAVYAITAPSGKSFYWKWNDLQRERAARLHNQLSGTPERPNVHVNLSLQGNSVIRATLKHIVFVNCDFRGSYFHMCTFEGVTFLNCRLDGSMLSQCLVKGAVGGQGGPGRQSNPMIGDVTEPIYVVPAQSLEGQAEYFLRYLPGEPAASGGGSGAIYSQRAGRPATAVRPDDWDESAEHDYVPTPTGLAIYGSRISAMTLRGLEFEDGAALALRSVTGAGLDIVEMMDGSRISILGSSLRGTSLSTAPGVTADRVDLTVDQSVLVQTSLGRGLRGGRCCAQDSMLIQVWNRGAVGPDPFVVEAKRCKVLGLVGVSVDQDCRRLEIKDDADDLEHESGSIGNLNLASDAMTYRKDAWS